MKIIHSGDLTAAEWQAIAERYDGWHTVAEFWIGFNDYQHGRYKCPDDWADIARQVWDLGIEASHSKPVYAHPVAILADLDPLVGLAVDVRFGSKADIGEGPTDVRFYPKSGH